MRGLLHAPGYRPLFSGHETFALRQLWLKKAVDAVERSGGATRGNAKPARGRARNVFGDDAAIVVLGVGKNMVGSIRHWATACDVLAEVDGHLSTTEFGAQIFSNGGLDPYSEHPTTLWLVHWKLAGGWALERTHRSTTWFWVFNHIHEQSFTSKGLLKSLDEYARERGGRLSAATLKRDVEVCFRCYVDKSSTTTSVDDFADSMLGELGLLSAQSRDEYALRRGPKSTLSDGAFLYALIEFWQGYAPDQATLSFDTIAYEIGSPGRAFKLDEDSVAARLIALDELTGGSYQWSDSAGLRQVVRTKPVSLKSALELAYAK